MPDPSSALVEMLKAITAAFNAHDLDAIMAFFAEACSLDMPRGPEPWGARYVGKAAVREGLAARFEGLPDVHYGDDRHDAARRARARARLRSLGVSRRQGDSEGLVLEVGRETGVSRLAS